MEKIPLPISRHWLRNAVAPLVAGSPGSQPWLYIRTIWGGTGPSPDQ